MQPIQDIQACLSAQAPLKEQAEPAQDAPFKVGDLVSYAIPGPQAGNYKPGWVERTGRVRAIDQSGHLALLIPETEPGLNWRWWCR